MFHVALFLTALIFGQGARIAEKDVVDTVDKHEQQVELQVVELDEEQKSKPDFSGKWKLTAVEGDIEGMMTEAGGLDVYEMTNMLYAKLCPPGIWPLSIYATSPQLVTLLTVHHLVGLSICMPLCIYYSGNFEF